ncbi:MAG: phosphatidylserine decarboxylase [Solobacterium sp.]|nr:phosphatidylserine decarboxylase [Solobacterium sp.]MBQ6357299.1 phosphatidylserine decarboxylase [Solobacterium sp.]MBQ6532512.1 phosphatidylserine decarboxylase [Solobacterium sp.]MBR0214556.1 phosphatidylserine decarboxylase [Solobacterium sp.]
MKQKVMQGTFTTTDLIRTEAHEDITWDLIHMAEHDSELKELLQTAIAQAYALNPDPETNPVSSLDSYYEFLDRSCRAMPWAIHPEGKHIRLYDQIDQSMGCFYFIADQPLAALAGRGYYYNCLTYHEPFRSWLNRYIGIYGAWLNTPESWCDEYLERARANPDFNLEDGLYEDPSNWHSFNDFFARRLRSPEQRPVSAPDDDSVMISPADAAPQGVWQIDENSRIVLPEGVGDAGVGIKTAVLSDVSALLGRSQYAGAFAGGTLTHTFLDVNNYHRYHFPFSGTIREVFAIPAADAPGGVITWNKAKGKYQQYHQDDFGWQIIESRAVITMELNNGGLAAIVPVGMCQVSSVNFEPEVVPGAAVKKGDPMGYFLFGGSDIVILFSRENTFTLTAETMKMLPTGREYGRITGK